MQITIPEDQGGELRVFQGDVYEAAIQDLFIGTSKTSQAPKITVKWVMTSEYSGFEKLSKQEKKDYITTIGENVLEAYSLQPQAIWKLSSLWKKVTGEPKIPMGDYTAEDLEAMLKSRLVGFSCKLLVEPDDTQNPPRMAVKEMIV